MAHHDDREFCHPPFSRLFIIHGKSTEEATIRDAFEKYGRIEDLFMVKDRYTREYKGFSYVKFEKTSQAALAMEEMTGRPLDGSSKPIKVVLANKRGEGSYRDPQEDEKMLRIFVMIPKDYGNKDLRKNFEEFGEIDYVEVVKDRHSGQNKGFGYIKYLRPYHAALALEKCDRKFKAKFADPPLKDQIRGGERGRDDYGRPVKRGREPYYDEYPEDYSRDRRGRDRGRPIYDDRMMGEPMPPPPMQNRGLMEQMQMQANVGMGGMGMGMNRGMGMGEGPPMGMGDYMGDSGGSVEVEAMISNSHVVRPLLQKLFDLIPGLEYFNYERNTGLASARYATPEAASRCVEKMSGFEYPPGSPITVRYARSNSGGGGPPPGTMDVAAVIDSLKGVPNANNLIGAMKQIASILENKPTEGAELNPDGTENVPYCGVAMPQKQARLSPDAHCEERLFVVCKPYPVNEMILTDAFCRFGNLIEVFLQPGKNFGYARYGSKESAEKAIDTLNHVEINGQLMKVLVAEAPRNDRGDSPHRKRTRNSEHWES